MNIGSLYASFGIDVSEAEKEIKQAEAVLGELGKSVSNISEEMETTLVQTFRKKFPDAYNVASQKFLQLQDESKSFVEYLQGSMPGAFQKVVSEANTMGTQITSDFQESNSAMEGVAGTAQIINNAMAGMATASEKRKSLLDEEMQSLVELQIRKQAAYDPDEIIKYDNEIRNVQKRIKLLSSSTSEFKDISLMSLGEMKQELRSLRNTPLSMISPEELVTTKQRMADLTEGVQSYSKQLKVQGDSTQRFITGMQGMVGVVQGVTGTLALFGIESENVEKTMLAFMNVSQALNTIHDLSEKGILSNISAKIKDVFITKSQTASIIAQTAALKANQQVQNFATKSPGVGASTAEYSAKTATGFKMVGTSAVAASGGVKVLGVALKALPFVGVVAAVAGLVYSLVSMKETTKETEEAQLAWNNVMKDNQALKDNKQIYDNLKTAIRDLGLEYDVLTGKMSQSDADSIKSEQDAAKQKGDAIHNYLVFKAEEESATNKLLADLEEERDAKIRMQQSSNAIAVFDDIERLNTEIENLKKESNKRIIAAELNLQNILSDINKKKKIEQDILDQKDIDDQKEKDKQILADKERAWGQYLTTLKTWQQKIQDLQDNMIVNEEQQEIAKLERRRQREMEDLKASGIAISERGKMEAVITEYYEKEKQKIYEKYIAINLQKQEELTDKLIERRNELDRINKAPVDFAIPRDTNTLSALLKDDIQSLYKYYEAEKITWDELMNYYGQIQTRQNAIAAENPALVWAQQWSEAAKQMEQEVNAALQGVVVGMAEMMGNGTFTTENFSKLILNTLADLAINVGKIAIGVAIAVSGIQKALESLQWELALTAGVALVALGTAAKGALANAANGQSGGSVFGLASGGTVTKAGSFLVGENGPELVNLPGRARVTSHEDLVSQGIMSGNLVGVIRGSDLKIILERTEAKSKRR